MISHIITIISISFNSSGTIASYIGKRSDENNFNINNILMYNM